jgi:glycosyltransferase involved in cell wall biosynthesis
MARRDARIFVSPGYAAAARGPGRQILTLHDLIHLKVTDERSAAKSLYYGQVVLPAVRRSNVVLTVSEFSRSAIAEWSGLDLAAVVNVSNGLSLPLATDDEVSDPGTVDPYVLFVGNEKPHKGFDLLVRAVRHLPPDVQVIAVGVSTARVVALCEMHGVDRSRLVVRNDVPDDALVALYTRARCLALPSSYEGFGLIALESMARGTPVVYGCDAVAEVVGELGTRVELNPEAFAAGLALHTESGTTDATALRARASTFSWEDVGRRVSSVIEDATVSDGTRR